MQSGIALSAFLMLKICDNLIYRSCVFLSYLTWPLWWGFAPPTILSYVGHKVGKIQLRLRRFMPAIKSATVEFHKAQCFFMLSIEVAAQIVVKSGSLNEGTTTLQGLFNNYSLIGIISISGLLPVTFTLLTLHSMGMNSWYLLSLSTCTVAMSTATLIGIGDFNVTPTDMAKIKHYTSAKYPKCGVRDPTTFCLQLPDGPTTLTSMDLGQGAIGGSSLVFSLFVLSFVLLDSLNLRRIQNYKHLAEASLTNVERTLQRRVKKPNYRFLRWIIENRHSVLYYSQESLYAAVWTFYIVFFVYFLKSLTYPGNGARITPVQVWTFGQIVAITVWAVPLFEFLKLTIE